MTTAQRHDERSDKLIADALRAAHARRMRARRARRPRRQALPGHHEREQRQAA